MRGVGFVGVLILGVTGSLAAEKQDNVSATEAPADCILAINLARTAHLNTRLPLLDKDTTEAKEAKDMVEGIIGEAGEVCTEMKFPDLPVFEMAARWFEGDDPKCKESMQKELKEFLTDASSYPPGLDKDVVPWKTPVGQSFARYLAEDTKKVGCAMTQGCGGYGKNILLCKFSPTPASGKVPFGEQFFTDLQGREKAGIDISKMSADDLNTGSGGSGGSSGSGGTSGATTRGQGSAFCVVAIAFAATLVLLT